MATEAHQVLTTLGDLDRFLVGVIVPALKCAGIGREHWQVLRLLEDGQGRAMGEIAQSLGLSATTATRVVDALVTNTLAYRANDPFDRRRVLVHLSGPGRQALDHIHQQIYEHAEPALAGLTEKDRQALSDLAEKLTDMMRP